jgi:hypothetical protein
MNASVTANANLGVSVRHQVDINWAEARNQALILLAVALGIKLIGIAFVYALEK